MFQSNISKLQLYKTKNFSGLTESNHLSQALLTEPHKMGAFLSYAFGENYGSVLQMLTGTTGNVEYIDNNEYEWDLHGQTERAIAVARATPGSSIGLSFAPFQIVLEEGIFENGDVLASDNRTHVKIIAEPQADGVYTVYTVQLVGDSYADFIATDQVQVGARFHKEFTSVSEYSERGGGTSWSTPFRLRNYLTTLRHTYKVTRDAATDVMIMALPDPKNPGKTTKVWTKLAEWQHMASWYREVDRMLVYGKYNKTQLGTVEVKGANGRPVFHGAGLRDQIAPSNIRYTARLTYNLLKEFLLDLSYGASQTGGNMNFIALTGRMGMAEFDRVCREGAGQLGFTVVENEGRFISGTGQELTLQGQFKTIKFLDGITLTVKHFPMYDNIQENRELHPVSKKPMESYRMTFLNISQAASGQSNLVKVVKKDSDDLRWVVEGSIGPMSGVAKNMVARASGIDGYEVHYLTQCGIRLTDPLSCGEIITIAA